MAKETKTPKASKPKEVKKAEVVDLNELHRKEEQEKKEVDIDKLPDEPCDDDALVSHVEIVEEPKYGDSALLHADGEPELAIGYPEGSEPSEEDYKKVVPDGDENPKGGYREIIPEEDENPEKGIVSDFPRGEVIEDNGYAADDVIEKMRLEKEEDEDPIPYDTEDKDQGPQPLDDEDLEETIEESVFENVVTEGRDLDVGECYIVKVNRFLSNRLSKYSVRIATQDGFKELMKTGREKAFLVANNVNKANGHKEELVVIE